MTIPHNSRILAYLFLTLFSFSLFVAPSQAQTSSATGGGAGPGGTCNLGLDSNGDGDFDDTPNDKKAVLCADKGYFCKVPANSPAGKCTCSMGEFEMPLSFGGYSAFGTIDVCKWVNEQSSGPLTSYFNILATFGIVAVVGLGLIMIVIGGYFYMTAGGDAGRIGTAKTFIGMALLGIILALTAYLLLNTISSQFTDVQEPKFDI